MEGVGEAAQYMYCSLLCFAFTLAHILDELNSVESFELAGDSPFVVLLFALLEMLTDRLDGNLQFALAPLYVHLLDLLRYSRRPTLWMGFSQLALLRPLDDTRNDALHTHNKQPGPQTRDAASENIDVFDVGFDASVVIARAKGMNSGGMSATP